MLGDAASREDACQMSKDPLNFPQRMVPYEGCLYFARKFMPPVAETVKAILKDFYVI